MGLMELEAYYDEVPRAAAGTEQVGPFTLFVAEAGTGWQFYARPRLGLTGEITADDVRRLLARQAELGVPRAVEWIDQVTPSLLPAVRAAVNGGHEVELCPLLSLGQGQQVRAGVPTPGSRRVLAPDDPDLPLAVGAVSAAFGEHEDVLPRDVGKRPGLIAGGLLVVAASYDEDGAVVGGGSAAPRGDVAELTGIAVVGSARRRGHGSAVTAELVTECRRLGVRTTFLSAASDDAAGVYRALGFQRVGTACILGVEPHVEPH